MYLKIDYLIIYFLLIVFRIKYTKKIFFVNLKMINKSMKILIYYENFYQKKQKNKFFYQ